MTALVSKLFLYIGVTSGSLVFTAPADAQRAAKMTLRMMHGAPGRQAPTQFTSICLGPGNHLYASEGTRKDSGDFDQGYRHFQLTKYELTEPEEDATMAPVTPLWSRDVTEVPCPDNLSVKSSEGRGIAVDGTGTAYFGGQQITAKKSGGLGATSYRPLWGCFSPSGELLSCETLWEEEGSVESVCTQGDTVGFFGTRGTRDWNYITCKPGAFVLRCEAGTLKELQTLDEYATYSEEGTSCSYIKGVMLDSGDAVVLGVGHRHREGDQLFLTRFSKSGEVAWEKILDLPVRNPATSRMCLTADGHLTVAVNVDDATNFVAVLRFSSDGEQVWREDLKHRRSAIFLRDLTVTEDGLVFVASPDAVYRLSPKGIATERQTKIKSAIERILEDEAKAEIDAQDISDEEKKKLKDKVEVELGKFPSNFAGAMPESPFDIISIAVGPDKTVYIASRKYLLSFEW